MPYKNAEQARAAAAERQRKHRNVTPDTPKAVTPDGMSRPAVTPSDGWPDVEAYILRDSPRMPNLERLQRIAGSLDKYADQVMFGVSGLTMQDIGETIGSLPPAYSV